MRRAGPSRNSGPRPGGRVVDTPAAGPASFTPDSRPEMPMRIALDASGFETLVARDGNQGLALPVAWTRRIASATARSFSALVGNKTSG